jgi:iron complex transport system substrate-binding protein
MKMRPIIVSGLLVVGLAGCSSSAESETASTSATVIENCGLELTFDDPPERAITLEQNATEILLSLGVADRMVGSAYKIAPPLPGLESAFNSVPLLTEQSLSAESLREALPDFTYSTLGSFYSTDGVGTRQELLDLGVPSYVSETGCPDGDPVAASFTGLFDEYRALGDVFEVEDAAESLVATQQQVLDAAGADHPADPPTIAWFYSTYNGVPIVAGAGGMPSAISEAVGAENAFDDVSSSTWPEMSWEQIAQRDPDIIVIADLSSRGKPGDSAADKRALLESDPVASQLTAVKAGNIVAISGTEMDPSVRSVNAVDTLHTWLRESGENR